MKFTRIALALALTASMSSAFATGPVVKAAAVKTTATASVSAPTRIATPASAKSSVKANGKVAKVAKVKASKARHAKRIARKAAVKGASAKKTA